MNIKKVLTAGIAVWFASVVYSTLTDNWLFHWVYQLQPRIWKDPTVLARPSIMIGTTLFGLLIALLFVGIYALIYKGLPGEGIKKGLVYGLIVWIIGPLAINGMMGFTMNIAQGVIIYWLINNLVVCLLTGAIVAGIYKE